MVVDAVMFASNILEALDETDVEYDAASRGRRQRQQHHERGNSRWGPSRKRVHPHPRLGRLLRAAPRAQAHSKDQDLLQLRLQPARPEPRRLPPHIRRRTGGPCLRELLSHLADGRTSSSAAARPTARQAGLPPKRTSLCRLSYWLPQML